jgi:hypothetical protein
LGRGGSSLDMRFDFCIAMTDHFGSYPPVGRRRQR